MIDKMTGGAQNTNGACAPREESATATIDSSVSALPSLNAQDVQVKLGGVIRNSVWVVFVEVISTAEASMLPKRTLIWSDAARSVERRKLVNITGIAIPPF